jgi:Asp-tRNA(Asn)/Glu-tRNA(Gln) amidotransferase A subunit family amidase
MSRSLSSIQEVIKLIIDRKPWNDDPRVHRLPWDEEEYQSIQSRSLTIGLLLDDGVVKVHPPIERIVRDAAAKLAAAGHSIVRWNPDGHAECIRVMVR